MSVVTLSVNQSERGTVTGGGTYDVGSQVTVTANNNSGYFFACWSDGSKVVSANPSYTFKVNGDITLTAYFYSEIDSVKIYGMCAANCKHQVLNIGQVISLIQEMALNGFQVPAGYIPKTTVNSIVEQNKGSEMSIFVGTQAEWSAWKGDKEHTLPFITDANNDLADTIAKIINGEKGVGFATYAGSAETLHGMEMYISDNKVVILDSGGTSRKVAEASNAETINGVKITKDENTGLLKIGDIIIPQKKLIYGGINIASGTTFKLWQNLNVGDKLEIVCRSYSNTGSLGEFRSITIDKCYVASYSQNDLYGQSQSNPFSLQCWKESSTTLEPIGGDLSNGFSQIKISDTNTSAVYQDIEIYKIIE